MKEKAIEICEKIRSGNEWDSNWWGLLKELCEIAGMGAEYAEAYQKNDMASYRTLYQEAADKLGLGHLK